MIIDTSTQAKVYINPDVLPENKDGAEYFNKRLFEIVLDSIPNSYDGRFTIAFIVDTSGNVNGERVIKTPIAKTGWISLSL